MNTINTGKRILRVKPVCEKLGVARTTLWRWTQQGHFPKAIILGPNTRGWLESDVNAWIESRRDSNLNPTV